MTKIKRLLMVGLMVGLIIFVAVPAYSGSIDLKGTEVSVWVFIIAGGVIVLFQFIPAAILFFSFIGTISLIVFRLKKAMEELAAKEKVKVGLPGYEQIRIKKNRMNW